MQELDNECDRAFLMPKEVGNIPPPREYQYRWFMDMKLDRSPVGQDPLTGMNIYWGYGTRIACLLSEKPDPGEMPF